MKMDETMTYEGYIRSQIECGSCGVTIIPNLIAKDVADWIEKKRDAVAVVRCKDCKCMNFYEDGTWWCEELEREIIDPLWFCKYGRSE